MIPMQRFILPDSRFLPLGRHDPKEGRTSLWWSGSGVRVCPNATAFAKESFDVTDAVLTEMGVDPSKAKGANEGK